jgi:carbamoyl-phosphate synthase small subunit
MNKSVKLILEDGSVFEGLGFGAPASASGELVFNTGMVGYPESLTDPSYSGQLLVCTYPMIGNYGVPNYSKDKNGLPVSFESEKIQPSALIVSEICEHYSHRTAGRSLHEWLESEGLPGIAEVDTRAITKHLRDKGSMLAKIVVSGNDEELEFVDPNTRNMAAGVCTNEPQRYIVDDKGPTVVLVDCGVKSNIIRSLLNRGINVFRVPHDYYFLNLSYDGLVLSNGPGDPRTLTSWRWQLAHRCWVFVWVFKCWRWQLELRPTN